MERSLKEFQGRGKEIGKGVEGDLLRNAPDTGTSTVAPGYESYDRKDAANMRGLGS